MKSKKALVMAGVGTVIGLAAFAGVASAQSPSGDTSGQQSLASKIAAKFNLKESDVQTVFDQDRADHEAQMQQKLEDHLDKAVADGKITADQKTAIVGKLKDMRDYKASIADKPIDEQHQLVRAKLEEISKWAEDDGLADYLPTVKFGHGPGNMMKGGPMDGVKGGVTDSTNQ